MNTNKNFFYINKNFNSRKSFNFNNTKYIIARERLETIKAEYINTIMQCMFEYKQQNLHKPREKIYKQINKHKKKINYKSNDKIFLFSRNIIIDRSFKKLENKMIKLFSIQRKDRSLLSTATV